MGCRTKNYLRAAAFCLSEMTQIIQNAEVVPEKVVSPALEQQKEEIIGKMLK